MTDSSLEPEQGAGDGTGAEPASAIPRPLVATGVVVALALLAGIGLAAANFADFRHWMAFHTGVLHAGPDVYYNFWSGIGSDIGEITIVSAVLIGVYTGVRRVNCHSKRCWRIGHYRLNGTPFVLCRVHHPEVPDQGASHEHILRAYRKHEQASQ